jgi:hypothetical protein
MKDRKRKTPSRTAPDNGKHRKPKKKIAAVTESSFAKSDAAAWDPGAPSRMAAPGEGSPAVHPKATGASDGAVFGQDQVDTQVGWSPTTPLGYLYQAVDALHRKALETEEPAMIAATRVVGAVWVALRRLDDTVRANDIVELERQAEIALRERFPRWPYEHKRRIRDTPELRAEAAAARRKEAAELRESAADEKREAQSQLEIWEGMTLRFLDGQKWKETWSSTALPPRARVDRAEAVAELLRHTRLFARSPIDPRNFAKRMVLVIGQRFPKLGPDISWVAKRDRVIDEIARKYAKRIENKGPRSIDPEHLVIDALEAFGVNRAEAHDWLKGATKKSSVME